MYLDYLNCAELLCVGVVADAQNDRWICCGWDYSLPAVGGPAHRRRG